jgi:hypothetical protein
MTKSERQASLYKRMSPDEALKLDVALEDAIMAEFPVHIQGGDFGGELGWRRFVDKVAKRVDWSSEAMEDRESRFHLVALIGYKLNELTEQGVLVLSLGKVSPVTQSERRDRCHFRN